MRLLVLAMLLSVGCSRGERPLVQKVEVDLFEGRDIIGWEAPQLLSHLSSALSRAGFSMAADGQPAPQGGKPWRLAIAARIDEPDPEVELPGSAVVVLSLRQKGASESFEAEASRQTRPESNQVEAVQAAALQALELSLDDAASEARASIELDGQSNEAVIQKATERTGPVQSAAVRILARRGDAAALPALVKRLVTDDPHVLRRTIGLLVDLKNPSCVPAIIDASRGKSPQVQRDVVFALAAIGGDEAEAYLDAVASGHDDPAMRSSAERALAELRRRPRSAPSPQKDPSP